MVFFLFFPHFNKTSVTGETSASVSTVAAADSHPLRRQLWWLRRGGFIVLVMERTLALMAPAVTVSEGTRAELLPESRNNDYISALRENCCTFFPY